jgi:hypothetical protein
VSPRERAFWTALFSGLAVSSLHHLIDAYQESDVSSVMIFTGLFLLDVFFVVWNFLRIPDEPVLTDNK